MTVTETIRQAAKLLQSNPAALAALEAEEAERTTAAEAQARALAKAEERAAAGVAERARQIAEDWFAIQQEAITAAAERLARAQLDHELVAPVRGVSPAALVATLPPARLTESMVEAQLRRLIASTPLLYDKRGRTPAEVQGPYLADAAREVKERVRRDAAALHGDSRVRQAEQERHAAEAERRRQEEVAARKAAARAAGALPK